MSGAKKYIVQQSRTRLTKGKQNVSQELYIEA